MEIKNLIELISEKESKLLINYATTNNCYDIAPKDTTGSPIDDSSARPTIIFDITDDELIIKWIYLNKQNQGLGSIIISWLIDYCKYKGCEKISIRSVGKDKNSMIALAEKFGFQVMNDKIDCIDYLLVLSINYK